MQTYPKNVYYTVSLVGDRKIEVSDMVKISKALEHMIKKLLLTKKYVNFSSNATAILIVLRQPLCAA